MADSAREHVLAQETSVDYNKNRISVRSVSGASIVKYKPVFSNDSKYLLVPAGNFVRVYSTASGECLHKLSGHMSEVVSVCISPRNHLQMLSCSSDGLVITWDFEDGIALKKVELKQQILGLFSPTIDTGFYVMLNENQQGAKLVHMNLDKPKPSHYVICKSLPLDPRKVAVGAEGKYIARIDGNRLFVHCIEEERTNLKTLHRNQTYNSIATHPSKKCIATGDTQGRIFLWYDFYCDEPKFTRTVLHWHQLPVADIAFTAAGSQLLSVGGECTLVKWKVDTDTKYFVPRLGMPICSVTVSPDNQITAIGHVDNAIRLLDNVGKISHVIQGIAKGHHWSELNMEPIPTGLLCDPRTCALVLNGRPGHLQFYSLKEDKQLFSLDITGFNYRHRERLYTVVPTEVEKAAFSANGDWLATIQIRDDGMTSPDICLKFWKYSDKSQNFLLNTCVELPHTAKINTLKFQPFNSEKSSNPLAITTSNDSRFKLWSLVDDSDIYKERSNWRCESVGFYREMPCDQADFSEDGSVLAVSFKNTVTLWDPDTNALKASLSHARDKDDVRFIAFGIHSCSHLLVSSSQSCVTVWNVLSLSVQWCVPVELHYLVKHPTRNIMAAFLHTGDIFIFRPSEPKPLQIYEKVSDSPVMAAIFISEERESEMPRQPHTEQDEIEDCVSNLYFMNENQDLLTLQDEQGNKQDYLSKIALQQNIPLTPFGMLMAEHQKSDAFTKIPDVQDAVSNKEAIDKMLSAPSHLMPPVNELCLHFMKALSMPKKSREGNEEQAKKKKTEKAKDTWDVDSDEEPAVAKTSEAPPTSTDQSANDDEILSPEQLAELEDTAQENYDWLIRAVYT